MVIFFFYKGEELKLRVNMVIVKKGKEKNGLLKENDVLFVGF